MTKDVDLNKKAAAIWKLLKKKGEAPRIELDFKTPFQLLVAVILSAQSTDVRVNIVTKELFKKYKKPEKYYAVPVEELENDIRSSGFYRNKAKSLRGMAKAVVEQHGRKVPGTMEELVKLPGVGRKTANVILGECFDTPGIVVDTHVNRVSNRLGLVDLSDPVKIEYALNDLIPPKDWTLFSHTILLHGRYTCLARKPKCEQCFLTKQCDFFAVNG
jgi:endonuclease III